MFGDSIGVNNIRLIFLLLISKGVDVVSLNGFFRPAFEEMLDLQLVRTLFE